MADFLKYSVHFEGSQSGTIDRKRVGDPPGYQPSIARDAVSRPLHIAWLFSYPQMESCCSCLVMLEQGLASGMRTVKGYKGACNSTIGCMTGVYFSVQLQRAGTARSEADGLVRKSTGRLQECGVHVLHDVDEWQPDTPLQHHDDRLWHLPAAHGHHELQAK